MSVPFLKQVARHYNRAGICRLCFVFPNRRALRFFEHYLGQEIAAAGSGPAVAPQMFTMSDFVARATGERPAERVDLLLRLYGCYSALNPMAEPLDDFIFWGDTLLGDFDDVDKYLVNPEHLFTNVSDFKEMQDDYSYLSDTQREAIERFIRHFLIPGTVKERFLNIWRILLPLYRSFKDTLREHGLSYEGMMYRDLAESLAAGSVKDILNERFKWSERFVFVGLNALNECEKTLLRRCHAAGLAEFCWDWRSEQIRNPDNKSSVFLRQFTSDFPSAFEPDPEGLPQTEFNLLSVPGGIAQAKQLSQVLDRCTPDPGIETAIVLPDEQLLIPVLNSIPEHIQKLNVTMGYPISGSQTGALMDDLAGLQLHLRQKNGEWHFYHRYVWSITANPIVRSVLTGNGNKALEELRKERRYYIPESKLKADPVLEALFRPVATENDPSAEQVKNICSWLENVIVTLAVRIKEIPGMQMELDFARVCHQTVDGLLKKDLRLLPASLFRLIRQLLAGASVPFEGEPLEGMQIMGPLELRAMDFENLIILNFNEGIFPRRSVSASFIPPELRKGFGLPTYEYQDAVWAYYFYRMIQRASRVWMVFDSRADGLRGGEPSRYLRQLELHFGVKINRYEALSIPGKVSAEGDITKTPAHLEALHRTNLSASSLKDYLKCPVRFFYAMVEGLEVEKEIKESLDQRMQGTVFHSTMQDLYPPGIELDAQTLRRMLADKRRIRDLVEKNIIKELNTFEVAGRNIVLADIICSYVQAVLEADLQQVADGGSIVIKGAERFESMDIGGFRFVGYIDRLDSPAPGVLRVIDYKTGKVAKEDMEFGPDASKVPEIGLQLYLYKLFTDKYRCNVIGAIYQPAMIISGSGIFEQRLDEEFCSTMDGHLGRVLREISDTSLPWKRTEDADTCKYCDFRAICGR